VEFKILCVEFEIHCAEFERARHGILKKQGIELKILLVEFEKQVQNPI